MDGFPKTVTTHLLLSGMEICENSFSRRALFHLSQLQRIEDERLCLHIAMSYLYVLGMLKYRLSKGSVQIIKMERDSGSWTAAKYSSSIF